MIHYPSFYIVLIIIHLFFFGCGNQEKKKSEIHINYLKVYDIPIVEPSGLDLTFSGRGFWTVSDNNSTIYKLDNWGKIEKSFSVDGIDLEGVTTIDENTLAVVLEEEREIVILDTSGKELNRSEVNLAGEFNHGLEGITYDPENRLFFVLNEKSPCLLLTFDEYLNELNRDTLTFIKDASGIHFHERSKSIWILSDESRSVTKCDLRGNPLKKYNINVAQPEGLAIDADGKNMYIVSDMNYTLYVFKLE